MPEWRTNESLRRDRAGNAPHEVGPEARIMEYWRLDPSELAACEDAARTYMTGTRDGSNRPAWKHAEEVAAAMEDVRAFLAAEAELRFWQGVGWLHDVLEDCDELDSGGLIGELVLRGVHESRAAELVRMVQSLTKAPGEVETYFQRIHESRIWQLCYLKVADRILNLQEGQDVFTRKRWGAYVQESKLHVLPLLSDLPAGVRSKLFFVFTLSMFRSKRRGPRQPSKKTPDQETGT
jgi:hypothetical protein